MTSPSNHADVVDDRSYDLLIRRGKTEPPFFSASWRARSRHTAAYFVRTCRMTTANGGRAMATLFRSREITALCIPTRGFVAPDTQRETVDGMTSNSCASSRWVIPTSLSPVFSREPNCSPPAKSLDATRYSARRHAPKIFAALTGAPKTRASPDRSAAPARPRHVRGSESRAVLHEPPLLVAREEDGLAAPSR